MKYIFIATAIAALTGGNIFPVFAADSHESHHAAVEAKASYMAKGVVVAIDQDASKLKLRHEAIPELSWPGMTMSFGVADKSLLEGLKVGDKLSFELIKDTSTGQYVVKSLKAE